MYEWIQKKVKYGTQMDLKQKVNLELHVSYFPQAAIYGIETSSKRIYIKSITMAIKRSSLKAWLP